MNINIDIDKYRYICAFTQYVFHSIGLMMKDSGRETVPSYVIHIG